MLIDLLDLYINVNVIIFGLICINFNINIYFFIKGRRYIYIFKSKKKLINYNNPQLIIFYLKYYA